MNRPKSASRTVRPASLLWNRWCFAAFGCLLAVCCSILPVLAQPSDSAAGISSAGSSVKPFSITNPFHKTNPFSVLLAPPSLGNSSGPIGENASNSFMLSTADIASSAVDSMLPTPGGASDTTAPISDSGNEPLPAATNDPVFAPAPAAPAPVKPDKPARIPVLNYHSITVDPGNPATITPEKFAAQMRYLSEKGYTTLTLKQFSDMLEGIDRGPDKPVLLTFDDGYADNYVHALPLLKELGFHATLFMSPGMVEDGYFLNWEQVKEMHEAGWDIQPHGMTHPHLPKLNAKDQAYEIGEAKKQIEQQLGTVADVYCYPYGQWNTTTLRLLKELNFRYAFTIEQGMTVPGQDRLKLKRIFANGEETLEQWRSRFEK